MQDDPNAPPLPQFRGKAGGAALASPDNPQWWLAGSVHPYAPFVGNALKWESNVYDDGTTYEGLMMNDVPHNKGTIVFGNGLGGGIQKADRADKYEGEFDTGFAHGLGQYTSTKGKVYRGEFTTGMRHGCGAEYDMTPFLKRVERGMDPDAAWAEAKGDIEGKVTYGTWLRDTFFTGPDDSGRWCHINEIRGTIQEVEAVVAKARMFQYKPDGEVTLRFAQDGNGVPAPLMQDPIHYPHGTKFLAPGPMGQCFPIPDDENLKASMATAAANHRRIFDAYNLPYDPEPGSDLDRATKLWKRKQARRGKALERKLLREQQKVRRMEGGDARGPAGRAAAPAAKPDEGEDGGEDDGFDEDDLLASAAGVELPGGPVGGSSGGQQPPSVLASVSVGLNRAAVALHRAFRQMAVTAPPRRGLTRPQQPRQ